VSKSRRIRDQVVSLDNIAPAAQGLRITFVNVFGIAHRDGSWTLIDAGGIEMSAYWDTIQLGIMRGYLPPAAPGLRDPNG
jgi:hypothetical protein